jgi:pimeloyl-ACP methyl ester carboxylesterase
MRSSYWDLRDVILVGHSYGGMVITGVADRGIERIGKLVYLDVANPADGQSLVCTATLPTRDPAIIERARAERRSWDIDTGHDLMITEPEFVAGALQEIVAR